MGEYQERATSHLETCPKVKVPCPNAQCPAGMPRGEISTHRSTCDYEPISCKYAEVGCEERPPRKDIKKHEEDDRLHLRVTIEMVLSQTKTISILSKTVAELKSKASFTPLIVRMTDFEKHKTDNDEFLSPPYYTSPTGYKMCLRTYAKGNGAGRGTHVSVYVCLMKGDNDDSLTWPFTGTVTFELLNQLEDENHHKSTTSFKADSKESLRVVEGERRAGYGRSQFISHTDLTHQPDRSCQYLLNDTLVFRVSVQVNNPHPKPWLVSSTY